jgi:hypothetical protein
MANMFAFTVVRNANLQSRTVQVGGAYMTKEMNSLKAHIPITNAQRKRIEQEVEIIAKREIDRERADLTRRLFKTIILALHEEFGFGQKKCLRALGAMTEIIERSDNDEVFLEHIDKVVIDYLKMDFKRDYTDRGKVRSERNENSC